MSAPEISVIIPTYNEEGNIRPLYDLIVKNLNTIGITNYEIIYVNDGSHDNSLKNVKEIAASDPGVKYISFSHNFGHQNALKAGLDHCRGKAAISMDADLQHPPEVIPELIEKWKQGHDIVYTIRKKERGIGWIKKTTSKGFYWLINKLSESPIIDGAADFRLLDRKVVDVLKNFKEKDLFFRGLVSGLGFRQTSIEFVPNERFSGKTKYSFKKMARFAIIGITSSSAKPLYFSIYLGSIMALFSFLYGIYAICIALFTDMAITGWTSILTSIVFIGGIQLIILGIIGIYLGQIFRESKNRPSYIIEEMTVESNNE